MGPPHTSQAIILRTRAYGESDKIVTFLSDDAGKLTGMAKGAKNSRRRFANCLDPFTVVRVHYRMRPGAGMVFMDSCDLLQPPGVLSDPTKFAYGSYLLELIEQLTAEAQPVGELFRLLLDGLEELRNGAATAAFLRAFELRLLRYTGYDAQLAGCAQCHRAIGPGDRAFLHTEQGHVICAACRGSGQSLVAVSGKTLAVLEAMKSVSLREARGQRLGAEVAAEAAQITARLLALHLPRPLRSVKLIAALSGT